MSALLTAVAWTLTRTSPVYVDGLSTEATFSTDAGRSFFGISSPALTIAFIRVPLDSVLRFANQKTGESF